VAAVAPALAAPAGGAGPSAIVLGPDRFLYGWRPDVDGLQPLSPLLARLDHLAVNDLAVSGDGGTNLVLTAAAPTTPAGKRQVGLAVVVASTAGAILAHVLHEIPFEGDGRRGAVSRDGKRAYVLAMRAPSDAARGQTRFWIHELDLETGRVSASAQLEQPPDAIALDAGAARLFLAYAGRIASFTTRPLASSWHYRSPGANRGLYFRPGSAVLYAVRKDQVALFDPNVLASMRPEERRKMEDEATAIIRLPFSAGSLLFSPDGRMAAVYGEGMDLAFLDSEAGRIDLAVGVFAHPEGVQGVRPFLFEEGSGDLLVATFPDKKVLTVHPPAISSTEYSGPLEIARPVTPPTVATPVATPTPAGGQPAATPSKTPVPEPMAAALAGQLSGRVDLVKTLVMFGPGSIVREQARVTPAAGGAWRVPLPPPGLYRIVPLGEGSRPLRCEPNFLTVDVKESGRDGLDFKVLGAG